MASPPRAQGGYVEQKNSPCEGCSKPKSTMERSSSGLSIKSRKLELCTPTKWPLAEEGSGGGGRREAGRSAQAARGSGRGARESHRCVTSAAPACRCCAVRLRSGAGAARGADRQAAARCAGRTGDGIPTHSARGRARTSSRRPRRRRRRPHPPWPCQQPPPPARSPAGPRRPTASGACGRGGAGVGVPAERRGAGRGLCGAQIPTSGRPKRGKRRRGEGRGAR